MTSFLFGQAEALVEKDVLVIGLTGVFALVVVGALLERVQASLL